MKTAALTLIAIFALVLPMQAQLLDDEVDLRFLTKDLNPVQSKVYFGIFTQDLTPEQIEDLGYNNLFGVLITGVVDDSPANQLGLMENDVIMEIDGQQVTDQAEFDKIRAALEPGQVISLLVWRDGREIQQNMTMQPRPGVEVTKTVVKQAKPGKSVGYGGGSWVPYWMDPDITQVNALLEDLGFQPVNNEHGLLMQGGAGKGNVGKGFFLGGVGAVYEDSYTVPDADGYRNWMRYALNFGGVTLDKRFPIARDFIGSVGVMLGAGSHEIELVHSNDVYSWPEEISDITNSQALMKRSFAVIQPKFELMYMLLPWLGLRAEVGYLYGYAPKSGWQVEGLNGDFYHISGSPDTPFQGLTLSAGPWFGF